MNQIFATEKLKALYPKVKAFIEQELYPSELYLLTDPWDEVQHILNGKRENAKKLGLWAPYLPENDGGF